MDYKIKHLPKSEVEISITVEKEKMDEYRKKACEDISKEVSIKGFRAGHIPQHILEGYVEKKYIDARTQEIAIQRAYADVVVKENIQIVSRPKIKIEKDEPFEFIATVAILPEVDLKDYKSIKVKKEEAKVGKKDIEDVLSDMKKYSTTYKEVDRASKKGDRVEVDFEGFDDKNVAVPNTKSQNHPVILGEGSLVKGFEEELTGMKKGDKKEFDITFPKDYGKKDFQNKKIKFRTELKMVEEAIIPQIDEAFIEKMTGKKQTVAEFEKEIEENIKMRKEVEAKQKRENQYIEELLKIVKVEIPDTLIDEEVEYILHEMKDEIEMKGLEFNKFLESAKVKEEDLRKKYRPEGEKRIKIRLALQTLIKKEDIKVTDEQIKEEFEKTKMSYPKQEHAKMDKEFKGGSLPNQLANRIALRKLFEKVLE